MAAALIGRGAESERLAALLARAHAGAGAVVLLSGDAGVGKTRLTAELARHAGTRALVLGATATQGRTAPYGPLVAVLRGYTHARPGGLDDCGPLRAHLARILPELGAPAADADRATLFEAIRCALARIGPALVVLDDLQWSDEATLEVLAALAAPLADMPLLVVGAYRSDGLPRTHGVRRLRNDLRRGGRLEEIALAPLAPSGTAQLLEATLGDAPAPALVARHPRPHGGHPVLRRGARRGPARQRGAAPGPAGGRARGGGGRPDPGHGARRGADRLRGARRALPARGPVAAVAGEQFDLGVVAGLAGDAGLSALLESGIVLEQDGTGTFRHALTREAIYADLPWMARRSLHRELAGALEAAGADSGDVAPHWLAAHNQERARAALLLAAAESEAVHAYRDAAEAGRRALELWPDGADAPARAEALERYARCSQLAGELGEAVWAWRELLAIAEGDERVGRAQRSLAAVHELRGDREAAVAARLAAAAAFGVMGADADAAVERIAIANQRRLAARHGEAVELAALARADADRAGRVDLRVRAMGVEGMALAKLGDYETGLATVRAGLAEALEHDLTAVAAELYQRLSVTLYESADYRRAEEALDTALELCRTSGDDSAVGACVSCLAYVLRERGEWSRSAAICRDMIAAGDGVFVAQGLLGAIYAGQGKWSSARRLLSSSLAVAGRLGHYNMTVDTTAALARVAAAEGDGDEAAEHIGAVLARWERSDDRHYALGPLRWGATFFAVRGDRAGAQACAGALTRIAAATGHADALAALAHAIGETALLEGDAATAADQLARAVELHRDLDLPHERAHVELRAGVALAAAGERELAIERLCDAYRVARKLGARPLAADAANELGALGESVVARLGVRAEADAEGGGLSRREREVLRLVAVGRTNREIAHDLFLSPRTVDMHVRNILRKLDCRSRVEAAGRARELGMMTEA